MIDVENKFKVIQGRHLKQTAWPQPEAFTWSGICDLATDHKEGPKDGPCIISGQFNGGGRSAEAVYQTDLAILDSDAGHTYEEIASQIRSKGLAACIYSTHSHMKAMTTAIKTHVDKAGGAELYLADKYLPHLCTGATLDMLPEPNEKGHDCVLHHESIPRFRIVFPLAKSWVRSDFPTADEARMVWRRQYQALIDHLGLRADRSGADLHRLFFLPRHAPGAPFVAEVIEGDPVDIFSLEPIRKEEPEQHTQERQEYQGAGNSVIAEFNQRHTLEGLLEQYGYQKRGAKWLSPHSSTGEPGITIKDDRLFCHHESDPLFTPQGSGARDAFDTWAILLLGTGYDEKTAVYAAAKLLGIDGAKNGQKDAKEQSSARVEWEDPKPLPISLPDVEAFDYDLLPEPLQPWARDICERVGCPLDYVGVAIMTALGAVIGRKVGIRPQSETDWTVTPNQWALCVGRPGVLKSPAMDAALSPLKRLVSKALETYNVEDAEFSTRQRLAKLKAEATEKAARRKLTQDPEADVSDLLRDDGNGNAPVLKRYIANNTTAEALGELHRQNTNGLLVFRDELVSLLKTLEREDASEARGFYLTGWNGDSPYTFDRIGRGMNLHIPAVCLSLMGSTQPGKIAQYVLAAVRGGNGDDGLLQRFGLTVWPDVNGPWQEVDRWPDKAAKNQAFKVFEYLDTLDITKIGAQQDRDPDGSAEGIPYLRFEHDGLALFREWRSDLESRLRSGDLHPALEAHLAKYRKLVPGLALTLHLACGDTGPATKNATLQALAWADYLESHAKRLYASVASQEVGTASAILNKIKSGALVSPFASWNVWRSGWAGLSDRDQVKEGLQLLVDFGWLRFGKRSTGGRAAEEYEINPKGVIR